MQIVTREGWGAAGPKRVLPMHPSRRDRIFVHWPAMPPELSDHQMLLSAQRYHKDTLGWDDIGYSVALGRDGKMYILRGPNVRGGHTKGENDDSYGLLVLTGIGEAPTDEQLRNFPFVVEWLRTQDPLLGEREDIVVVGHRHDDEASTECPGPDWAAFAWDYKHSRDYPELEDPVAPPAPDPDVATLQERVDLLEVELELHRKALEQVVDVSRVRSVFYEELGRLANQGKDAQ